MKYGIFSGTFDPFTDAHYEIVKKVLSEKLVDKVIVLPTIVDYYRQEKVVMFDYNERRKIIEAWFEYCKFKDNVILDFSEYDLRKWNLDNFGITAALTNRRYFNMLEDIKGRYHEKEHEYYTIIGEDSWDNLHTWFRCEDLVQLSKFIVVRRGDFKNKEIKKFNGKILPDHVLTLHEFFANGSATDVRNGLKDKLIRSDTTLLNLYLSEIKFVKEDEKENDMKQKTTRPVEEPKPEHHPDAEGLALHTPIFDVLYGKEIEKGFRPVKVESPDWVTVIVENNGDYMVVEQLRHGTGKTYDEFPCGVVEANEHPYETALRELKEETGVIPVDFDLLNLGKFPANPGFMTNNMHYFYVRLRDFRVGTLKLDAHEHVKPLWFNKTEVFETFCQQEGSALMGCAFMLLAKNGLFDLKKLVEEEKLERKNVC